MLVSKLLLKLLYHIVFFTTFNIVFAYFGLVFLLEINEKCFFLQAYIPGITCMMASRGCLSNPNSYCYVCGEFVVKKQRKNITDFVKKAYYAYFGVKLGDQDRNWAPHIVCSICVEELRQWTKGEKKAMRFGVPMIWREQKNHSDDCYFCTCKSKGIPRRQGKILPIRIFHQHCDLFLMVQMCQSHHLQITWTMCN